MGIIEDITNMKNQGMQENEIYRKLQEKGVSPKAVEDAFNQIKIKNAVSAEYAGEEGMEPSIMKNELQPPTPQAPPLYAPKTQEIEHDPREFYSPQPMVPQFNENIQPPMYNAGPEYGQEQYIAQEGYVENPMGGGYDTDTIIEITEQVFSEKIKKEQKQIESLNEFATLVETRISNYNERIKRIESIIDKLQIAILEKIGSYGKNIESIKNEMGMMQESFEKMVPILHEKSEEKKTVKKRK
ncbi:MAG TPA: hypothetical protein PLE51_00485 [Candidatus Pacearchaeota archaeon]|nr:hypothetical protein [Candidatus Pacearchaeota archaeon]HOR52124.1 hypothetical protein [Candidatus Pacearchaeota archaeon]HPJ86520.1 hypothetical protein [Candidatus Pacearchaeota archaeon]HQI58061.1 hypothetical protein [Candidatus Pacearchaeota archaeon]